MDQQRFFLLLPLLLVASVASNATSPDVIKIIVNTCNACNETSYSYVNTSALVNESVVHMYVPEHSAFFIVQVHNYLDAVQLAYDTTPLPTPANSVVSGTNIGLVQALAGNQSTYQFNLFANFTRSRLIMLAMNSYSAQAPIPGGCNMEFNTAIAPYQHLKYDANMITVDVQKPKVPNKPCEYEKGVSLEYYELFLEITDSSMKSYYDAIVRMLTVKDIKENGYKSQTRNGLGYLRRLYANYIGYGTVYAAIAKYQDEATGKIVESAYIPIFSYGCDMHTSDTCFDPERPDRIIMLLYNILSACQSAIPMVFHYPPIFNILFYGTETVIKYCGVREMEGSYKFCIAIGVLLIAWAIGRGARKIQLHKTLIRLYAGHVLTTCVYISLGMFFEFVTYPPFFWILYASLVAILLIPIFTMPAVMIIGIYHLGIMIDYIFGSQRLVYLIINAMRRVAVPQFYLASGFYVTNAWLSVFTWIIAPLYLTYGVYMAACNPAWREYMPLD